VLIQDVVSFEISTEIGTQAATGGDKEALRGI